MNNVEIRKKILTVLLKAFNDRGKAAGVSIPDIASRFDIDPKQVNVNADYLVEKGYARYMSFGPPTLSITSEGIDFVENPPDVSSKDSIQQSVSVAGDVGQIFQAKEITINIELLTKHMDDLVQKRSDLSPEQKKNWRNFLKHPILIEIIRQAIELMKG